MSDLNGPKIRIATPAERAHAHGQPATAGTLPASSVPLAELARASAAAAAAKGINIPTRDVADAATTKAGSTPPHRRRREP